MTKVSKKTEIKSDEQFITIQAEIESNTQDMKANKKDYDEKTKNSQNNSKQCPQKSRIRLTI